MPDDDDAGLDAAEFARWWSETGERELRQILVWKWDPIGVTDDFPVTADEYDGYAPQIVQRLRAGATPEQIDQHLIEQEGEAMGLDVAARRYRLDFAGFLVDWFQTSTATWADFGPMRR